MKKHDCLFCKISEGKEKAWIVWEDDQHIAFLTPFPNTPGFTVLATKEHEISDIFNLTEDKYIPLLKAARSLSKTLQHAFNCQRVGMIMEGMGVNHAHVKLIPMHGISGGDWKPVNSANKVFTENYLGYLSSHDGPKWSEDKLDIIATQIKKSIDVKCVDF